MINAPIFIHLNMNFINNPIVQKKLHTTQQCASVNK
jgi:hypothetical protein